MGDLNHRAAAVTLPSLRFPGCQAGFSGGLVVDYPHSTRAKKFFLVLMVGPSMVSMPQVGGWMGVL